MFLLIDYIFFFSYTWVLIHHDTGIIGVMKKVFLFKNAFKLFCIITFFIDSMITLKSHPKVSLRFTRILRALAMCLYSKDLRRNILGIN